MTDLGKVASKVSEQWLYNYLKNPKRISPGVEMPRFRFSDQELAGVVAYMESEFVDYDLEQAPPAAEMLARGMVSVASAYTFTVVEPSTAPVAPVS